MRDAVIVGGVAVAVVGAVYVLSRHGLTATVDGVADATGRVIERSPLSTTGTPYEGWGIAGGLGAATNRALGGLPESFGSWIGRRFADLRGL